jgi:transcriptional regulator with XRE-family HTH domain
LMHGSLATRLRVLRAERGLTVRQVAELSGVAKETISQVERGERHPYDRTLARLARAYGVPVEELLEEPVLTGPKADAPYPGRESREDPWREVVKDALGVDVAEILVRSVPKEERDTLVRGLREIVAENERLKAENAELREKRTGRKTHKVRGANKA